MANSYTSDDSSYNSKRKRPYDDEDEDDDGSSNGTHRDSKRTSSGHSSLSPLIKLLIPNYAAGIIIGKGGSNITDLQNKYGTKIRLSPSGEFYPGTPERIVILTGEIDKIIDLNNYIIDKVYIDTSEGSGARMRDEERGEKVKFVLPNATAGLVIGRAGSTIKSLQEETKAKIIISSRDEAKVQGERILTISGNTEQRMEAARQIISKIASDPENMSSKNLTYANNSSSIRNTNDNNFGSGDLNSQGLPNNLAALSSMLGNLQNNQSLMSNLAQNPLAALQQSGLANQLGFGSGNSNFGDQQGFGGQHFGSVANNIRTTVSIKMEIPDILVGVLLGKQGKTVHELIQISGAKIQFSAKNEYAPGTTDRILTIQGDLNQTQKAYYLVNQKLMQAEIDRSSGSHRR